MKVKAKYEKGKIRAPRELSRNYCRTKSIDEAVNNNYYVYMEDMKTDLKLISWRITELEKLK